MKNENSTWKFAKNKWTERNIIFDICYAQMKQYAINEINTGRLRDLNVKNYVEPWWKYSGRSGNRTWIQWKQMESRI